MPSPDELEEDSATRPPRWLPSSKKAAICFTIDDVHPGTSNDAYEGGGDLDRGALGHVAWLLDRHPQLRVTLFVTPEWREISPVPTRRVMRHIPFLRDRLMLAPTLPKGTMRLDRHPRFVRYLKGLPRTEISLHGLQHIHRGERLPVEFQEESLDECVQVLERAIEIFRSAGLGLSMGMTPPGWNAPANLLAAMARLDFAYVASARDVSSPIAPKATAEMSGLRGVSLIYPEFLLNRSLIHFSTNFQATSEVDRARQIIELGGIVAIKGHIVKNAVGHVAVDGIDPLYRNYLDLLFGALHVQYGASLWWCSMGDIAARIKRVSGPA